MSRYGLQALAQQKREERDREEQQAAAPSLAPPADPGLHPSRQAAANKRPSDSLMDKASSYLKKRRLEEGSMPPPPAPGGRRRSPSPDSGKSGKPHGYDESDWNNADEARVWYEGSDEFGGAGGDGEGSQLDKAFSQKRLQERAEGMNKSMQGKVTVRTLRAQQRNEDQDKWEESRMHAAGAMLAADLEAADDDLDADMVRLITRKPKPSFLRAGVQFSKRAELVLPVKDVNSELYENAKKGSALLRFVRAQKDRQKADRDSLDDSGTLMGKISSGGVDKLAEAKEERRLLRLKRKAMTDEEVQEEETVEARKNASFGASISGQNWSGATDFSRQTIQMQREGLPVFGHREQFLKVVRENEIVVLVGETGSGKTTQIAQYLYEAGYCNGPEGAKLMVGCTQPRRVAAMSVAKRVAEEAGTELGDKVGYAIRFEDCTSEHTQIKYMTDGVLLREIMRDPELNKYSAIIMDEAHERSLNTDVLFGILKKCVGGRRDLKLIVTSATMDSDTFCNFFGNCPLFKIPGRTFPVDEFYQETNVSDYVNLAVQQAVKIHVSSGPGDILIFMTGQEEIEVAASQIQQKLLENFAEHAKTMMVLPIYSLLPSELQAKIFNKAPPGVRKCIIATNIAETSLTVDGIFYVIDTGFCKLKMFNPKTGMDCLQVFPESQAAAKQRSGRAGRTGPGKCFRLYTQYQYQNEMLAMTVPEIQRTSLSSVILLLKSLGVKDLLSFPFMSPPPQDNMTNSMYHLWMLGALNDKGDLTATGHEMNDFPVDPAMAKCLLVSLEKLGCSEEMLTVVSCLSSQANIFLRPKQQEDLADQMREKFIVAESDHLTLLNAYQMFKMNGRSQAWCAEHFMNFKALKRVEEVRVQLREILVKKRKTLESCDDWDAVRRALCAGYFPKCSKRRGVQDYITMLTGVPCCVHPSSALFNGGTMPDYVVYHELVFTQREYMNTVSVVDGRWVAETAPKFFGIRGEEARVEEVAEGDTEEDQRKVNLRGMSNQEAINAVLGKKKQTQQILGMGGSDTPAAFGAGARRATPARTPAGLARGGTPSMARPGTPGYRRKFF